MRLWSLHPCYLDAKGLVALWREALLAQKVLQGNTKGYRNHPQLIRFKQQMNPEAAIASYLCEVQREAGRRGYHFDASKIAQHAPANIIPVTGGQLAYEFAHLEAKLKVRDAEACARLQRDKTLQTHPLFEQIKGEVELWEIVSEVKG
jgi:Pyrimidine dimer DNA glycosylase